jgi:hypothetical protein
VPKTFLINLRLVVDALINRPAGSAGRGIKSAFFFISPGLMHKNVSMTFQKGFGQQPVKH